MSDQAKRAAAWAAAALIQDGMTIGLGSGSTAALFHEAVGERIAAEGISVRGVAPSRKAEESATRAGIPLIELTEGLVLDLAVDGADEVDTHHNCIKGGGGDLVREKITVASAKEFIVVADDRKNVQTLGLFPLPVAIFPFGWQATLNRIYQTFGVPAAVRGGAVSPFVTDDGLYIADVSFGAIPDPAETEARLRTIVGVAECGLFVGIVSRIFFGHSDGSVTVVGSGE